MLTEVQVTTLTALIREGALSYGRGEPPRLDLAIIQRYVLWRVFDLGWTTERFGWFDRFAIGYHGREARKAERIGKKYQWIAYHEILAYITDHLQFYGEERGGSAERTYDGPWQEHLRDIDPSTTLKRLPEADGAPAGARAWWAPYAYDRWDDAPDARAWAVRTDDLPPVPELLTPTKLGEDGTWCSLAGGHSWHQPVPLDRSTRDLAKRNMWYHPTAYFVRSQDRDAFMRWAEGADMWDRSMPSVPSVYGLFLGEYAWAPASRYFGAPPANALRWLRPGAGCPVDVRDATFEYVRESSTFDCAVDDTYRLHLPPDDLVTGLGLRWRAPCADFVDAAGNVVVFDPSAHESGPGALLVQMPALQRFMDREGLALCWTVRGEKRVLGAGMDGRGGFSLRLSSVYTLDGNEVRGFAKYTLIDEEAGTRVSVPG